MAMILDPTIGRAVECIKKGKNSKGQQIWLNKETGKRFVSDAVEAVDAPKGKAAPKSKTAPTPQTTATPKSSPAKTVTNIFVNSEKITSKPGELTKEAAFDLIKDHFREVAVKDAVITKTGNEIKISFQIKTGTKGF